jgi:hypothetical protein
MPHIDEPVSSLWPSPALPQNAAGKSPASGRVEFSKEGYYSICALLLSGENYHENTNG